MFGKIKDWLSRPNLSGAAQLAPVAPPKVKPGLQSYPSYVKSTAPSKSVLPAADRRLANTDTTTLRNGTSTRATIRDFCAASPDLSAAKWAYLRLGIPQKYTAVALNPDGSFNREGTLLCQQLLTRFDILPDYAADGFTGPQSVRSISESLGAELIMYGSCSGELVLNKARQPSRVQPVSTTQIQFIGDPDKTIRPVQKIGSETVDLDIPTFVYVALDQDLLEPYSASPIESAIKPAIFSEDFAQDIHRIIKKVIHPRQKVTIDEDSVRKNLSVDAQNDAEKAREELNGVISQVEGVINGLRPEEALVLLSSVTSEVENSSNSGLSAEYEVLSNIGNSRMATGSKTMGTVLGHSSGSSNIASTEALLFQKSVTGAVTTKLNEFWSRMLTVAVRLFGMDVVIKFEFADIDLRPEADLAAFRQTQQMMTLEQLSYGFITDEEAALKLTGKLPPAGFKPLSGTRFKDPAPAAGPADSSNSGSTLNQNLNGKEPSTARGQNKKAENNVVSL